MMGIFTVAMAAVMFFSGAGIDRLNEQKAKNQQATELWGQYLQNSIISWLDYFDRADCACDMLELLYGPGSAKDFCGSRSAKLSWSTHHSYTVGEGLRWEEVRPEVRKLIEDEVVSIAPVLAEKIGPPPSLPGDALWGPSEQGGQIVADTLTSRIRDRGWDVTSIFELPNNIYDVFYMASNKYGDIRDTITYDTAVDPHGGSCCDVSAAEFCEANKDFPGCEQLMDIYGNCEKILADAANKNEL